MEKYLGFITANYSTKYPSAITESRPVASAPFLGRYRVVDFALSNMVNSGIRTVGMVMPYNYRSLIDHVGSGRDWGLNLKKGGLFILPGSAFGTSRTGSRFLLRDLEHNKVFLERGNSELVILSSASFVYNMDYNDLADAHLASGADITVLTKTATRKDADVTAFKLEDGRVKGVHHGVEPGDTAFLDCFVMSRTFLLQLLDWYEQTDYLDLFEAMAADFERVNVRTFDFAGYAAPIFNKDVYFKANMDLLDPKISAELFPEGREIKTKAHDNAPAKLELGSHVRNSRISGSCRIYGTVTNSILGRNVLVEPGAVVNNAIVMQSCIVRSGAHIEYAVVDRNNEVPADIEVKGTPEALFIKEKAAE